MQRSKLGRSCKLHTAKTWKALHFIMRTLKKGNNNKKRLAYTVLVSPIVVWSGVLGPYREGQVSALNTVQKRADKFANNMKESGWETVVQRRLIARICALFKAYTGRRAWKATGDGILNSCLQTQEWNFPRYTVLENL